MLLLFQNIYIYFPNNHWWISGLERQCYLLKITLKITDKVLVCPTAKPSLFTVQHGSLLVCSGCHNKIPQTRWLQQQIFIFPQTCRPVVQDQGVSRLDFSWGLWLASAASLWRTDVPALCTAFLLSLCAQSPPLMRTPQWVRAHPDGLVLTRSLL